jgi:hypothetical protein
VAEAVAPDQQLQSSVLYHGTPTTAGYQGIANQGLKIDPKLIAQKYQGQENFAPLPGVYMTKEFGIAVRYSFMSNVPDEQYAEYIKQEPNGYVFEFLGKDLTTVSPDEDELGDLLKRLVNTKNLQPNLSKIVQAVPEELRVKLQQPNVSFETIAVAGKWLVDRISDSTIQYLMKRYHNVVNYSGIKPSAVWVIPKPNERFLRDRQGTNNTHNGYFNYANKFGKKYDLTEVKQGVAEEQHSESCPHCGGAMFSEMIMNEKKDACYYKVKSRYKVWPSAYASGALVKCRKKGASNWGNGGKKNESIEEDQLDEKWTKKYKDSINCSNPKGFSQKAHCAGKQKNESAIMSGLNQLDEGWKEKLGAAALAGSMALGAAGASARVTPDGQGGFTGGLKPTATVTAPADSKPAAESPKGFSKEYLQKAADLNRTGRYMISVEKAQELLKSMP